ncbi:MAG TPA: sugar phosphate isomerase/epimerase family protein [Candidatus Binatia bacterium]|jgi:2-keto-myo-inositol isomerase|nr:sugar phosphate isomerase/epimerase family protein [Candidatus Binatia bacterium]
MNTRKLSRRDALARTGLSVAAAVLGQKLGVVSVLANSAPPGTDRPFRYCLNMATIRGHKLGIVKEIEVAAQAGYDAIEPWVDSIGDYVKNGGALMDLKKRISDSGLTVEGAIGFPEWIVDDEARRAKGMERARHEMDMVAQIGGKRFAAPPAGATDLPKLDLVKAAERYRALLEAGQQLGVVPQLELWGFSKNLNRLGECVGVAMETGHRNACVLADVFHLYKGGSDFHGMRLLGADAIQVLHMNDFPADPPREKIDDSYRVYPGDGTAPLTDILRTLLSTGGQKVLSLELFNRKYWSEDALAVARTGLAKMKAVAEKARS